MSRFKQAMTTKDTRGENNMTAHSSTSNILLDIFANLADMRRRSETDLIQMWKQAFKERPLLATRLMFYAGDIRGGQGERKVFLAGMQMLSSHYPRIFQKVFRFIPEYTRWKNLYEFQNPRIFEFTLDALTSKNSHLPGKWMPRKNQLNEFRKGFMSYHNLSPKEYRQLIVKATGRTVETLMCNREFGLIDYGQVPSVAMKRYYKAFKRNEPARFEKYLESLKKGEAKVNSKALFPHDVISQINRADDRLLQAQWEGLANYANDEMGSILPVIDVSGSMTSRPHGQKGPRYMDIAVGLGIYCAERIQGPFRDFFVSFSRKPRMYELSGSIVRKYKTVMSDVGYNTDLEATMNVILGKALQMGLEPNEMPKTLLIISDMQFDQATSSNIYSYGRDSTYNPTAIEMIQQKYANAGYEMPSIVFWNLRDTGNYPTKQYDENVALVGGASPSIIKYILSGEITTPWDMLVSILGSERYSQIDL